MGHRRNTLACTMPRTRQEHLRVLGLEPDSSLEEGVLQKAYYRRALRCHPDKGGDKEQFQELQASFEWLKAAGAGRAAADEEDAEPAPDGAYASDDEDFCAHDFWQEWFSGFFRSHATESGDGEQFSTAYEQFSTAYEKTAKERAQQRQANIRERYDWRDSRAPAPAKSGKRKAPGGLRLQCSFVDKRGIACTRAAITQEDARAHGLDWALYIRHPKVADGTYATCWACKNAHDTVMT